MRFEVLKLTFIVLMSVCLQCVNKLELKVDQRISAASNIIKPNIST